MIAVVCLSPVSDGGTLFTESCRRNKSLLCSSLSHSASDAGISLADETAKSKFGQLLRTGATNGTDHTPHSTVHDEAASPVGRPASDTPPPPDPVGRECYTNSTSGALLQCFWQRMQNVNSIRYSAVQPTLAVDDTVDDRVWSVQVIGNRCQSTLPSSSHADQFSCFAYHQHHVAILLDRLKREQSLEFVPSTIASQGSKIFATRPSSLVDTSDTSYHGLSRLCSYGANQDSNSSCYRGMPAIKEARHPVTTSPPWGSSA